VNPLAPATSPVLVRDALRIARAQPNVAGGIRAAIAATLPLLLIPVLGWHGLTWASLAGFNTIMVDKGGAYRTRATAMTGYAAAGSLAVFGGSLASTHFLASVAFVLVAISGLGMLRLYGAAATSIGISSGVALVIALSVPASGAEAAFSRAGFSLLGSVWALAFSLVLWPIRPYRPARLAVAASYRELATLCDTLGSPRATPSGDACTHERAGQTRLSIERARATLGALRRGRSGSSARGEVLVTLIEAGDQLFGDLIALKADLERAEATPEERNVARETATRIGIGLSQLAVAIEAEAPAVVSVPAATSTPAASPARRALDQLADIVKTANTLDGDASSGSSPEASVPELLLSRAPPLTVLLDQFTRESATLRHALRTSFSTAAAVVLTRGLHLHRGYWATLTCLVILQPYGAQTLAKALQRVGGTVIGAAIAIAVASCVHDPLQILGCVFVFMAAGVALMPINYGFFAVFLTPSFVLLAERSSGEPGLASVRLVNTFLGAAIALAGARLLFPLAEGDQLRPQVAIALRTLRQLAGVAASSPAPSALKAARRDVGLALANADASFQRRLAESPPAAVENEALLALLLYGHRIAAVLSALVATAAGSPALAALAQYAPVASAILDDLAGAVEGDRDPRPLPDVTGLPGGLANDLAIQHAATLRWSLARRAR
jgi:uncharacterized membrane protein YccC